MRKTKLETLSAPITFIELSGVNIEDVPVIPGQFSISEEGSLYYDMAVMPERLKLGGIRVEYSDITDPNNIIVDGSQYSYAGITDWDNDGFSSNEDLEKSRQGINMNEGDVFAYTYRITGDDIHDMRFVANSFMKTRNGTMLPLSTPSALADNTYFEENIKVTEDIGRIKASESAEGFIEINSRGKSVTEVIKDLLQVPKPPSCTAPKATVDVNIKKSSTSSLTSRSVSVSLKSDGIIGENSALVRMEAGTYISSIDSKIKVDRGSYTYGPSPTGVHMTDAEIDLELNDTHLNAYTVDVTNDDADSASWYCSDTTMTVNMTASVDQEIQYSVNLFTSKGNPANNNLGQRAVPEVILKNSSGKVTVTITGYNTGKFYGGVADASSSTLTYYQIRQLNSSKREWDTASVKFTVSAGSKIVVIAIPAGKSITRIQNITAGFPDVKSDFNVKQMSIGGADSTSTSIGSHASQYDVYYYEPLTGAYVNDTEFEVSFSD